MYIQWSTDLHVIAAVREHGLGEVVCLKFFENRANGQSKGYNLFVFLLCLFVCFLVRIVVCFNVWLGCTFISFFIL